MVVENMINWALPLMISYSYLIAFFSAALGGEVAILTLAFLSAQGFFPIWIVLVFGSVGTVAADSLWFLLTKIKFVYKLRIWKRVSKGYKRIEARLERISKHNEFMMLLLAKFLIGTRIVTILYIGLKGIKYRNFLLYDSATTLIWISVMILIGWLAGKGFSAVLHTFKGLQWAITFIIAILIIFFVLEEWINKKLMRLRKR